MATSEIEKLERRYAENPQGLTFAPLAEVHRKSGDVARALELLRAGLELHPNYIPASIVLGRCHWDMGDLPGAESAFAHVLRLDDENVIALKSLADINERLERWGEAQRWLQRLVSVDRSNDEAREQLSRLEAAKERGPRPEAPPAAAAEPKAPALEFLDTAEPTEKPAQPDKAVEAGKSEPQEVGPVPGLSTHEFVPPPENTYRLHPELTHDFSAGKEPPSERFDVETTEEVELQSSGATEFRVPNAAEDFMDLAARMNASRDGGPPSVSGPRVSKEPVPEPRIEAPSPRVEEPSLLDRAEAVPPQVATPASAQAEPAATTTQAAHPSYSARDTQGQSVAAFFQALLAARPPGSTNSTLPPASGSEPAGTSLSAQDGLSLSFGQESHPKVPPVPAGGQLKDAAVSFDDFFSSAGGGASSPGGGDPKNDDLDSFQSWLQNLKR